MLSDDDGDLGVSYFISGALKCEVEDADPSLPERGVKMVAQG